VAEELEGATREQGGVSVGVRGIRDRRVAREVEAVRLLRSGANEVRDVEELRTACAGFRRGSGCRDAVGAKSGSGFLLAGF